MISVNLSKFAIAAFLILSFWMPGSAHCQTTTAAHLKTFSYDKATVSLNVPDSFVMFKKDTQVGPVFEFSDPSKTKAEGIFFFLSISPSPGQADVNDFMDGVLTPYKQGLNNFVEEKQSSTSIGGSMFEHRKFSGTFPHGTPTAGFLYVTLKDGCYISLSGQVNGNHAPDPKVQLLEIVKSFQ